MTLLKKLKEPISSELKEFQKIFRLSVKSSVPLLDVIMNYILKAKGKQIRPLIVLYSAALFDGINDSTYRAATLINYYTQPRLFMMMLLTNQTGEGGDSQ